MNINRNNYEEFFLDFAEGKLTAEQEAVLNNFLKFNPDLEAELQDFDLLQVHAEEIKMPGKQKLKKQIPGTADIVNDLNFEMYSIAYMENDLTDHQRKLFEDFMAADQVYRDSFDVLKKVYLEPEYVPFPAKQSLKKATIRTSIYRILVPVAAAATIALLLLVRTQPISITNEMAVIPEDETEQVAEKVIEAEKPEIVKPAEKEKAANIQIIKSSRASVPLSDAAKSAQISNNELEGETERDQTRPQRIALTSYHNQKTPVLDGKDDQLRPEVLPLPAINMSSLAVADRIRYQLDKASSIMNEDDVFIWNLAGQGIEEINKLVGTDMSLMASQDEDGTVSGFRFKSRFLNVTAPLD